MVYTPDGPTPLQLRLRHSRWIVETGRGHADLGAAIRLRQGGATEDTGADERTVAETVS